MKRPAATIPTWKEEFAASRAETCIVFLAVHGLLSDGEKRKVRARLERSVAAWNAKVEAPASSGAGK